MKGSIQLYFCFEVANEILLEKIEKNQKVLGKSFVFSLLEYRRLTPKYIKYKTPPLMVNLGFLKIGNNEFEIIAKIYEFGVVTIKMILPIATTIDDIVRQSKDFVENKEIQRNAEAIAQKVKRAIHYALVRPYQELEWEDYSIFIINDIERPLLAKDFLNQYSRQIASILRSEENLSEQEITDAIKNPQSYTPQDLLLGLTAK